jgi:hypothetical protein
MNWAAQQTASTAHDGTRRLEVFGSMSIAPHHPVGGLSPVEEIDGAA